jgi:hypothetical protein
VSRKSSGLLTTPVLACCLALSLGACGGGGREYTVPAEACGVPVSEKALEPFLVDGEEFRAVGDSLGDPGGKFPRKCEVWVDDWLVFGAQVYREDRLVDPMGDKPPSLLEDPVRMKTLPFGGRGAVDGRRASVGTRCAAPGAEYLVVDLSISLKAGGDLAERRRNVEALALDFVPEVKKALGCTE